MKRLLIPFIALALCPPVAAHFDSDEIAVWVNAAEVSGEIKTLCLLYDKGVFSFKLPARIIADRFTNTSRGSKQKFLISQMLLGETNTVKNEDCRALIESYKPQLNPGIE